MSSRRKAYDGSISGSSPGDSKRRDPDDNKVEVDVHVAEHIPRRYSSQISTDIEDIYPVENDKDRYLITYADLITLLLGLFIILYAMSNIDLEKYKDTVGALGNVFGSSGEIAGIENPEFLKQLSEQGPNLFDKLKNVISDNSYEDRVKLIHNERGITVSILEDIIFASGKAEITDKSKLVLGKIATVIRTIENDLRIEGHTDNIPIASKLYASNWHLSVARATNTAYYFMEDEKILPDRVSIVGYSEYKPVATNDTEEGRAQNRRVDIVILNK